MRAIVAAFNQEKALIGAFTVITNLCVNLRFKLHQQLTAHCCRLQLHLDKKKQIKKKMNKRKFVAKLQAAVITLTMLLFVLLVLSCIIYLFTITE